MGTNLRYAVRDWIVAEEAWRWRVVILSAFKPDASDDLWSAIQEEHVELHAEATEIADALADMATRLSGRRKYIAEGVRRLVVQARDEVSSFPAESFSPRATNPAAPPPAPGAGKLSGLGAVGVATWAEVWAFGRRALQVLIGVGATMAAGTGAYLLYDNFLRSPASRAGREAEGIRAWERERQADLAACSADPDPASCRDRVNKQYDAGVPSKCDILDTPLGSSIGTIVGIGFGYAGMRKIMEWT